MMRCLACESFRDVQLVESLPWCFECRADGVADDYAHRVSLFNAAAIDAEVERRLLANAVTSVNANRFS